MVSPLFGNLHKRKSILFSQLGVQAGDSFTLDRVVLADVSPPPVSVMTIGASGALRNFGNASFALTANSIVNSGSLIFESSGGLPYTGQLDITLAGAPVAGRIVGPNAGVTANDNNGSNRALLMMPGNVTRLRGMAATREHRAKLQQTGTTLGFAAGSRTLTLDRALDPIIWKAGKRVAIGPTGLVPTGGTNRTEIFTLAADAVGNTIQLLESGGLGFFRFAQVQYGNDASANVSQVVNGYTIKGLSVTPGPTATKPSAETPSSIDTRASVMLLDRNIAVRGANDSYWADQRFGGHCMVMGLASETFIDGVLFERMGQGGTLGRYPWHWHMPSYDVATGATLGDYGFQKAVFQNNAVFNSANRACTLHGVRGAAVRNNSAVQVFGHAYFLEDGSEMMNTVDGNWAYKVSDPGDAYRTKVHDIQASGFWISNAGNHIINNVAGDCVRGVWYAPNAAVDNNDGSGQYHKLSTQFNDPSYVGGCFGLSKKVAIYPKLIAPNNLCVWDNNTGHSCSSWGALSNNFAFDEAGNTRGGAGLGGYTQNGEPGGAGIQPFFKGTTVWKNSAGGGYSNRLESVRYSGFRAADNPGDAFNGQISLETPQSFSDNHLLIGRSLNVEPIPAGAQTDGFGAMADIYFGFATYHGLLIFRNVWGFNFVDAAPQIYQGNVRSSALSEAWDLYTDPVFQYFASSTNWVMQNCIPMFRTPPPHLWKTNYAQWITGGGTEGAGFDRGNGYIDWAVYTLAAALYDPNGTLSGDPTRVEHTVIFDVPYLTAGLTDLQPVAPSYSKTVSTGATFYGMVPFANDVYASRYGAMVAHMVAQQVNKADNSLINGAVWDIPSEWGQQSMNNPGYVNEYPHGYPAGTNGASVNNPGGFHHFAVAKGQRMLLRMPNLPNPVMSQRFMCELQNLQRSSTAGAPVDDVMEFGIEWSGSVAPSVRLARNAEINNGVLSLPLSAGYYTMGNGIDLTASGRKVNTLAAFNSGAASAYFHDTANQKLWIRVNARDYKTGGFNMAYRTGILFQVVPA